MRNYAPRSEQALGTVPIRQIGAVPSDTQLGCLVSPPDVEVEILVEKSCSLVSATGMIHLSQRIALLHGREAGPMKHGQVAPVLRWNSPGRFPHEATFPCASAEFAYSQLPPCRHEALIAQNKGKVNQTHWERRNRPCHASGGSQSPIICLLDGASLHHFQVAIPFANLIRGITS